MGFSRWAATTNAHNLRDIMLLLQVHTEVGGQAVLGL